MPPALNASGECHVDLLYGRLTFLYLRGTSISRCQRTDVTYAALMSCCRSSVNIAAAHSAGLTPAREPQLPGAEDAEAAACGGLQGSLAAQGRAPAAGGEAAVFGQLRVRPHRYHGHHLRPAGGFPRRYGRAHPQLVHTFLPPVGRVHEHLSSLRLHAPVPEHARAVLLRPIARAAHRQRPVSWRSTSAAASWPAWPRSSYSRTRRFLGRAAPSSACSAR